MNILITLEILDSRICDIEPFDNIQTYREFIHESLQSINQDVTDKVLDNMTDDERVGMLEFADEIWGK